MPTAFFDAAPYGEGVDGDSLNAFVDFDELFNEFEGFIEFNEFNEFEGFIEFNEFNEFEGFIEFNEFEGFIGSLPPSFISPGFLISPILCPLSAIDGTEGIIAGDCIEEAGEEARNGCTCPCIEAEGGTEKN